MIPEREDNILDLGLKLSRCYVTYTGVIYLFQAQKGQAMPQRWHTGKNFFYYSNEWMNEWERDLDAFINI